MGQHHRALTVQVGHEAGQHCTSGEHVGHGTMPRGARDAERRRNGLEAVVRKTVVGLRQRQRIDHWQVRELLPGKAKFVAQKAHIKGGVMGHKDAVVQ